MEGSETANAYALLELEIQPGSCAPPHKHAREDETFYVLEGNLVFDIGTKEIKAGPGSLLNLPREMPHCFRNAGKTKARVLLTISPAGLEEFFVQVGHSLPDRQAPLVPSSPKDIETIKALAPHYGLELLPPRSV